MIQEGLDALNKAIQLKENYDDAMAYINLLYRRKADIECGNEDARKADFARPTSGCRRPWPPAKPTRSKQTRMPRRVSCWANNSSKDQQESLPSRPPNHSGALIFCDAGGHGDLSHIRSIRKASTLGFEEDKKNPDRQSRRNRAADSSRLQRIGYCLSCGLLRCGSYQSACCACGRSLSFGSFACTESYLRADLILEIARHCGADAIHPGYRFLAENADFAAACEAADIHFLGPTANAMRMLGSKTSARQTADAAGLPRVPGSLGPVESLADAKHVAARSDIRLC